VPGFTRPLASWVWRNALIGVIAVGSLTAGITLALTVGAARATKPIVPAPDYLLSKQPAPAFTLTDQNGTPVSLAAEKGHVVLLTFMDPQCTLLCPIMGQDIAAVEKRLPKGLDPVLLIVSVAPGRDRADVDHFIATGHLNWLAGWHWLLGPSDVALKLAWASWHIAVEPTAGDVNHDALLDVIDSSGHLRVTFPAPLPVSDVVSAIDTVART
jgi:cytochrome oxidase Cu insertion factor (SCO1/SenC/PrrC family)